MSMFIPEMTAGHAGTAPDGVVRVLCELIEESWPAESDVEPLAQWIMHGGARELFRIEEKFVI